jgi:hypothetical protein
MIALIFSLSQRAVVFSPTRRNLTQYKEREEMVQNWVNQQKSVLHLFSRLETHHYVNATTRPFPTTAAFATATLALKWTFLKC